MNTTNDNQVPPALHITCKPLRHSRYAVFLGDRHLKDYSAPFFSAARFLMAEGFDPDATLTMSHEGSGIIALRQKLRVAAGLAVVDDDRRGLRIVRYRDPTPRVAPQRVGSSSGKAADQSQVPEAPSEALGRPAEALQCA